MSSNMPVPLIDFGVNKEYLYQSEVETGIKVIGLIALSALSGFAIAYFASLHFHSFINNTISQVLHDHISIGRAAVMIGLPSVAGTALVVFIIYILRRHQKRMESEEPSISGPKPLRELKITLEQWGRDIKPSKRQILIGGMALLAAVVAFTLLYHFIPSIGQALERGFNHKMVIWEALSDMGIGGSASVVAAAIIFGTVSHLLKRKEESPRNKDKDGSFVSLPAPKGGVLSWNGVPY